MIARKASQMVKKNSCRISEAGQLEIEERKGPIAELISQALEPQILPTFTDLLKPTKRRSGVGDRGIMTCIPKNNRSATSDCESTGRSMDHASGITATPVPVEQCPRAERAP
jgi:hypothetical protein